MNTAEKHLAAHFLVLRNDHPATTDIRGEHFTNAVLRVAWDKARTSQSPWDVVDLLGLELASSLGDVTTHAHEIPGHIDWLKSNWARRRALSALTVASDALRVPMPFEDLQAILGGLSGSVTEALAGGPHDSTTHAKLAHDVARQFVTDLQTEDRAIHTPWPELNRVMPGIPYGKVTLIGGRSSEHKTTLARLLMHYAVKELGLTGEFWTGEDSSADIARRNIASEVPSLTVGRFASGRWNRDRKRPTEDELRPLMHAYDRHARAPHWERFRINDSPFGSIDNVCAHIAQQHARHGIRIFVGDFIQLIPGVRNKDDWTVAMARLAATAKQLDLIMIWTSQVDKVGTRESKQSGNRPPQGIDMLFGTSLRQQAYAVFMVGVDDGRLNIVVDKHKSARPGTSIQLELDAPHDRLGNYP